MFDYLFLYFAEFALVIWLLKCYIDDENVRKDEYFVVYWKIYLAKLPLIVDFMSKRLGLTAIIVMILLGCHFMCKKSA